MVKQDDRQNCVHMWHRRLGHRDPEAVIKLSREKLADGIKIEACNKLLKCINCIKGKMARKTIPKTSNTRAIDVRADEHSDSWRKEIVSNVYRC